MVIAGFVFLCLVAITVVTGQVVCMAHHSTRHVRMAPLPERAPSPAGPDPATDGRTVCTTCRAEIVDRAAHESAEHQLAAS